MSVMIMSMSMYAQIGDLDYIHKGYKKNGDPFEKIIKVSSTTAKTILVNLADHANDEGKGAYPGLTRLEIKTDLSRVTLTRALRALEFYEYIKLNGQTTKGANDYSINIEKILSVQHEISRFYDPELVNPVYQGSKPSLPPVVNPVYQGSKPSLPEPSVTISKPSETDSSAPADNSQFNNPLDAYFGNGNGARSNGSGQVRGEPSEKKKRKPTEYQLATEHLARVFAEARGLTDDSNFVFDDWYTFENQRVAKATNKRIKTPLGDIWKRCGQDLDFAEYAVREVVKLMRADDLTFDCPDQIIKTFGSWIADNKAVSANLYNLGVIGDLPEVVSMDRL